MKVAILGCGPAGLLSALAVEQAGHHPVIYSKKVKSEISGAMYLHRAIPGLTSDVSDGRIHVFKRGHREGYALKVYGDINAPVSWDKFEEGTLPIWYMDAAYDELWSRYESQVIDQDVTPEWLDDLCYGAFASEVIISTLPANVICKSGHGESLTRRNACWFQHQKISILRNRWIAVDEWHLTGRYNLMSYSGQLSERWYRHSDIRGLACWEFAGPRPDIRGPEGADWVDGIKPTRCACSCWPGLLRVGRFGAWDKHQLSHHAYEKTEEAMRALQPL